MTIPCDLLRLDDDPPEIQQLRAARHQPRSPLFDSAKPLLHVYDTLVRERREDLACIERYVDAATRAEATVAILSHQLRILTHQLQEITPHASQTSRADAAVAAGSDDL
jgi:hypothetical protein